MSFTRSGSFPRLAGTIAAIVACAAIAAGAGRAQAQCRPFIYGMGHYLASWAGQPWTYDGQVMDRMVEMGATAVWIDLPWAGMEPTQGSINWAYADHQVVEAQAHGLEMFAFVGTTPDWARLYMDLPGHRTPPAEQYLPQFNAFHTAVAARYAGKIKYYQFWNEPSGCGWVNEGCSNGGDCSLFTLWQQRAYDALKAGNPDCVVSAGGFDGDPAGYVNCMYSWVRNNGGGRAFDAISIHPYAGGGPGGPGTDGEAIDYNDLTSVRDVMVANGDADKNIWITEYGWSTTDNNQKAEDLLEVLTELKKPQYNYLFMAKYLVLNDWTNFCCFGLVDPALEPNAAFDAFKNFDKTFPPSVDFRADVTAGVVPLSVRFTDLSCVAGASSWLWEFGDNQISTLPEPSHVYASAGTYTVRLTITGAGGAVFVEKYGYVTVTPGSVDFSAAPAAGPAPLACQFADQTTVPGVSAWLWDFGDGQTSTLKNPTHTYSIEGSFTVRLTVTTPGGPQTLEKVGFIRAGNIPKVAFIAGSVPLTTADAQIIDRLESFGLVVDIFDDEPSNRPTADQICATHNLVIASSTVISGNVGGEFRHEAVPFIYWEPSLSWTSREALAEGSGTESGLTQLDVVDNSHPVMAGIPLGPVTVTIAGSDFSLHTGPIAPGVQVLATKVGDATRRMVMVAEPGAQLLDGGTAAGKRIFLYFYDTTWSNTNDIGKKIFDNAVAYSLGTPTAEFTAVRTLGAAPAMMQFTDQSTGPVTSWTWDFGDGGTSTLRNPSHVYTQAGTFTVSLTVTGPGQPSTRTKADYVTIVQRAAADLDGDGDVDGDDLTMFKSCFSGANVPYEQIPLCEAADLDPDGDVDQSDFGGFQRCLSGAGRPADANCAH